MAKLVDRSDVLSVGIEEIDTQHKAQHEELIASMLDLQREV